MVIAYHAIWSAYGFWLPNEQRGSWSTEVWAPNLRQFGPATKTTERRSLANRPFDPALRREIRDALKHPPVRFSANRSTALRAGSSTPSRNSTSSSSPVPSSGITLTSLGATSRNDRFRHPGPQVCGDATINRRRTTSSRKTRGRNRTRADSLGRRWLGALSQHER